MQLNHLTSKSLSEYDLFNGWWYDSCPECNKALSRNNNYLRCTEHDLTQCTCSIHGIKNNFVAKDVLIFYTHLPCAFDPFSASRFRLEFVVVDDQDVTSFKMVGKTAEIFF
jgi:replication factor A1